MAAPLLYLATAVAILWAWNRFVQPIARAAAIVLILLPLLFTGRALLTGGAYSPADLLFLHPPFSEFAHDYGMENPRNGMISDLAWQIVPWQRAVRNAWQAGEWPLWNPSMLCGDVLAGTMQPAPFDPFNLVALLLPLHLATTYGATINLFLAALFAFALARECVEESGEGRAESGDHTSDVSALRSPLSRFLPRRIADATLSGVDPALVAAAGYSLSAGIAFFAGWPIGRAWALVPFLLFAVSCVVRERTLRSGVLLAIAFVLLILAGHPETLLHAVSAGIPWGLFEMLQARRQALRSVAIACAAGIVALLVTAIALLPFLAVLKYSWEYHERASAVTTAQRTDLREVRNEGLATFLPFHGGASWHSTTDQWDVGRARVGGVVLALAFVALVAGWRNRWTIFLAGGTLVCLLAGWNAPPVSRLLRVLPLFNIAANYSYAILAALGLSLLAAIGAGQLRGRGAIAGAGIALAVATALVWRWELRIGVDPKWMAACTVVELAGIAAAFVAFRRSGIAAIAILLAAIGLQRVVEDGSIYPTIPPRAFYPTVPLVAAIPRDPLYRVTGLGSYFAPNVATMYGLDDVRGYEAMTFAALVETYPLWCRFGAPANTVDDLSRPFLSFLGVRYALAPVSTAPPDGWRVVRDDRGSRLLENSRALPRVFAPRNVQIVANIGDAGAAMLRATDFAETAWLFTRDVSPRRMSNGDGKLDVHRAGSRYEVDATMRSDGWIVVSESAWPGWRAYVDGRRVKTIPANIAFFAVFVPAGRHHVRIVYLPDAFVRGRAISFATLGMIVIGFGLRRWRR